MISKSYRILISRSVLISYFYHNRNKLCDISNKLSSLCSSISDRDHFFTFVLSDSGGFCHFYPMSKITHSYFVGRKCVPFNDFQVFFVFLCFLFLALALTFLLGTQKSFWAAFWKGGLFLCFYFVVLGVEPRGVLPMSRRTLCPQPCFLLRQGHTRLLRLCLNFGFFCLSLLSSLHYRHMCHRARPDLGFLLLIMTLEDSASLSILFFLSSVVTWNISKIILE